MADLKVVEGKFGLRAPAGLADDLRRMADAVDHGELTDLVACFVEGGHYNYLWGASLLDSIAMTTMAQAQAIQRMRE